MITQISQGAGGGGVDTDEKSKVSSNDTTAGYLNGKLVAGTNVTFTENNDGGNETLTIAAAGGVTGFTASQNTASPNDTVNASRLLVDAASTNADAVLQPKGSGAILAQLPDGTTTGGNKRGLRAVDLQTARNNAARVASGTFSTITGGESNTASANYTVVSGGSGNNVSRSNGYIGGGDGNTISTSGTHQVIAGGQSNTASNTYATVGGGTSCTASGQYSTVAGGSLNVASGNFSAVVGGVNNTASASSSLASGNNSIANAIGMRSHASGTFAASGDAQVQEMVVRAQSTSAAQVELTADAAAWTTANTMQVPTDGALAFDILLVARRTDANNECAAWTIRGCIDNNAGTVAFVGTPTKTSLGDDSGGAWDVAADTDASQRLRVLALGQTGKTINWVAHIRATRVVG